MTIIRTYDDIRQYVVESLADHVKDFDVVKTTNDLIAEFNITGPEPEPVDSIPSDRFWEIAERHRFR